MDVSERPEDAPRATPAVAGAHPIVACWSCRGPADQRALFCDTCGAVQPPGQIDHFSRLDLEMAYPLNQAVLDRRYFERQRLLHPDRFVTRAGRERTLSQSQASAINEAYETLKDPLRRADYLLQVRRAGANPEGCILINDQALLTEALELREALAEAETVAQVDALARQAQVDIDGCIDALSSAFSADDLDRVSHLVTRLKYLRKLSDDCRGRRLRLAGPV